MNQDDALTVAACIDALIVARLQAQMSTGPHKKIIAHAHERLFRALYTYDELTPEQHDAVMNDVMGHHGQGW